MTSCLLDTNAFAGIITSDPRVSQKAVDYVAYCSRVTVSAAAFYEIGHKVRLGRWASMEPFIDDLEEIAVADGYRILPLSGALALRASRLTWDSTNPFDRIFAAVALQEQVAVVSSNSTLEGMGIERVW